MGSKRSVERMDALHERLLAGMAENGIVGDQAEEIFEKLKAFADFGFPESHAYSFAYLVYASSWLKVHHPAAFYAGLLAAQPMGFYSPQSLVADARRHGVTVLRPDVQRSGVKAGVERVEDALGVRLGLAQIRHIGEEVAEQVVREREAGGEFAGLTDLARRVPLTTVQWEGLAGADALAAFGVDRRQALWNAGPLSRETPQTLPGLVVVEQTPQLPLMDDVERAVTDVWATGVSVGSYPTEHVRDALTADGVLTVGQTVAQEAGRRVAVAGVVTHRQRPGTAGGVTFLSLEDETGILNVVCSVGLWKRFRSVAQGSAALVVRGRVESADGATNLVAEHLRPLVLPVTTTSRDFR
jgi:error-prone DNA polymerase